jgi:hypothetical protein
MVGEWWVIVCGWIDGDEGRIDLNELKVQMAADLRRWVEIKCKSAFFAADFSVSGRI